MAKPLLPPDTILDAALALLDEQGAEALSARNLATALKCSTRTLYQQIGKREQLIAKLIAHHFKSCELAFEPAATWQESTRNWANTLRNALLAHPNLSRMLTVQHRAPIAEYVTELLRELLRSGFPEELALRSSRALANITLSLTLSELNPNSSGRLHVRRSDRELRFEEEAALRSGKQADSFQAPTEVFTNTIVWVINGIDKEFLATASRL